MAARVSKHNQSNKVNKLRGAKRRAHYSGKDNKYRTEYIKPVLGRDELEKFEGMNVQFSGEIKVKYNEIVDKPLLLIDVVVNGEYVDHTWIDLSRSEQAKLQLTRIGTRVYMTGKVKLYEKRVYGSRSQYGLSDVQLVKE